MKHNTLLKGFYFTLWCYLPPPYPFPPTTNLVALFCYAYSYSNEGTWGVKKDCKNKLFNKQLKNSCLWQLKILILNGFKTVSKDTCSTCFPSYAVQPALVQKPCSFLLVKQTEPKHTMQRLWLGPANVTRLLLDPICHVINPGTSTDACKPLLYGK